MYGSKLSIPNRVVLLDRPKRSQQSLSFSKTPMFLVKKSSSRLLCFNSDGFIVWPKMVSYARLWIERKRQIEKITKMDGQDARDQTFFSRPKCVAFSLGVCNLKSRIQALLTRSYAFTDWSRFGVDSESSLDPIKNNLWLSIKWLTTLLDAKLDELPVGE